MTAPRCSICSTVMEIDPTMRLTSYPPKPSFYCPNCEKRDRIKRIKRFTTGPMQSTDDIHREALMMEHTLDSLQKAIIESGGKLIGHAELRKLTVNELLNLLQPNQIEFRYIGRRS